MSQRASGDSGPGLPEPADEGLPRRPDRSLRGGGRGRGLRCRGCSLRRTPTGVLPRAEGGVSERANPGTQFAGVCSGVIPRLRDGVCLFQAELFTQPMNLLILNLPQRYLSYSQIEVPFLYRCAIRSRGRSARRFPTSPA